MQKIVAWNLTNRLIVTEYIVSFSSEKKLIRSSSSEMPFTLQIP
jgi:hypothetical protein